jgi:hypothetical protein
VIRGHLLAPCMRTPVYPGYAAYLEIEARDGLQVAIEVPLLVRLLRLPAAASGHVPSERITSRSAIVRERS